MDHRLIIAILDGFPLSWRYQANARFQLRLAPVFGVPGGWSATRKLSFAATWMNRRLFVEVILACNLSKESNA
jgi:hypothetical protein